MEKQITTIKSYDISKPKEISKMANVVKGYVLKNNLAVNIVGKNYVMVEGWQFAGFLMGLFPQIVKVENISKDKWLAQANITGKNGRVISSGYAICTKEEGKKASFDEYAILSMAQTRAIGKAYRNLIGWVMKLAGYEGTPAEEIKGKVVQVSPISEINKVSGLMASESDIEKIKTIAKEMGLNTIAKIEKKTGFKVDFKTMTKKQASNVYAELLRFQVK